MKNYRIFAHYSKKTYRTTRGLVFILQITKQKLSLANAKIDLRIKKESVTNGLLDLSFLNNAIIL
jgi:hypothetical protein